MSKKAIIYDLDNTIYPVHSIGESLFEPFLKLLNEYGAHADNINAIKNDMMRKPYQVVAAEHNFNAELNERGLDLIQTMTYTGPINYFEDYPLIKNIPAERFLVTTGFYDLQYSKINGMGIADDFLEIHVVDPLTTNRTKQDVFVDIMRRHAYTVHDVLVVGDDPASEIKAAMDLGIDVVLYDKLERHKQTDLYRITNYSELVALFNNYR
jgi:putative hydrolase of the HAD superfamily